MNGCGISKTALCWSSVHSKILLKGAGGGKGVAITPALFCRGSSGLILCNDKRKSGTEARLASRLTLIKDRSRAVHRSFKKRPSHRRHRYGLTITLKSRGAVRSGNYLVGFAKRALRLPKHAERRSIGEAIRQCSHSPKRRHLSASFSQESHRARPPSS